MPRSSHVKDAIKIQELNRVVASITQELQEEKSKNSLLPAQLQLPPKDPGLSRREIAVIMAGQLLALAGLVVEDRTTILICLCLSWLTVVYVCKIHVQVVWWKRVLFAVLATSVYSWIGYEINQKTIRMKQEDTYSHLSIDMQTPYLSEASPKVLVTIKNGGHASIKSHRTTCIVYKIKTMTGGGIVVPKGIQTPWTNQAIDGGGDGKTDSCSLEVFSFPDHIDCVDLGVKVEYQIEAEPDTTKEKTVRFVASRELGQHWFQESPKTSGNFCDGTAR